MGICTDIELTTTIVRSSSRRRSVSVGHIGTSLAWSEANSRSSNGLHVGQTSHSPSGGTIVPGQAGGTVAG